MKMTRVVLLSNLFPTKKIPPTLRMVKDEIARTKTAPIAGSQARLPETAGHFGHGSPKDTGSLHFKQGTRMDSGILSR